MCHFSVQLNLSRNETRILDHKLQFHIKKENSVEIKLALQLPLDIKYFCSMIDVGGRYISLLNYGQNYYEISLLHDV